MPPQNVVVETLEGQTVYEISKSAKGQELFNQYVDKKGFVAFLKMTKKRLFWLQIRDGICKDEIYAPPELCVLFAGQSVPHPCDASHQPFQLQAFHGDFDPAQHPRGFVDVNAVLPSRVLAQFSVTAAQWEEKIVHSWVTQKGLTRESVIMDYLTVTQDLEQYGVTYFEVTNKKGARLWLGVHSLGMDIYHYNNKVTPQIGFPWHEIRNISFNDKKFRIKMTTSRTDFKFFAPRFRINKRILALCVGNHQLYLQRRRAAAEGTAVVEDRAAIEAKIKRTKTILASIRADLASVHDPAKATREDLQHAEQEKLGLDKFKTMKKAQSGDASKRVVEFNNLDSEA